MATVAERILEQLALIPDGLDDGSLAEAIAANRATVNQVCRRLAAQGRLDRGPGPGGLIVNRLCVPPVVEAESSDSAPPTTEAPAAPKLDTSPEPEPEPEPE
ncbi:hypothetical protein UG55_101769, partial [Frankia sp. EI5c]